MNCVTGENYQITKEQNESLIGRKVNRNRNLLAFFSLEQVLGSLKYRWATTYKSNYCAITNASFAETAQASMKASNEKNISLVDSIYADISDSTTVNAKSKNTLLEEHCRGRGSLSIGLEYQHELR